MLKTLPVAIVTLLAAIAQVAKIDMPIELIEGAVTSITNLVVAGGAAYIAGRNVWLKYKGDK